MTPPRPRPAHADDLTEILAEAFRLLARGVADRRSAFHTPTLATVDADGAPGLRTLVLRGFDPGTRSLRLHTDRRAGKVAAIAADPRVALHVYDAGAQIQLRLQGHATLHAGDATAAAAWASGSVSARVIYAVEPSPGTAVPAPIAPPTDAAAGVAHFAVLGMRFDRLEWLWLAAAGHRRARFTWTGDALDATWLVP